jgi:hypothetical protein
MPVRVRYPTIDIVVDTASDDEVEALKRRIIQAVPHGILVVGIIVVQAVLPARPQPVRLLQVRVQAVADYAKIYAQIDAIARL